MIVFNYSDILNYEQIYNWVCNVNDTPFISILFKFQNIQNPLTRVDTWFLSSTVNFLNIWTTKKFVITLKFELYGCTIE